jgi:hypothetical protein
MKIEWQTNFYVFRSFNAGVNILLYNSKIFATSQCLDLSSCPIVKFLLYFIAFFFWLFKKHVYVSNINLLIYVSVSQRLTIKC